MLCYDGFRGVTGYGFGFGFGMLGTEEEDYDNETEKYKIDREEIRKVNEGS